MLKILTFLVILLFTGHCFHAEGWYIWLTGNLNQYRFEDGKLEEGPAINPDGCKGPSLREASVIACGQAAFIVGGQTRAGERLYSEEEVMQLFGICLANTVHLSDFRTTCREKSALKVACSIVAATAIALRARDADLPQDKAAALLYFKCMAGR